MSRSDYEHREQCKLIQLAKAHEHLCPDLKLLFAIPNGGDRDPRVGAKLKREGVKPGVPDLCLPVWDEDGRLDEGEACLWIEMKAPRGRLSKAQRWWHERLRYNHHVAVCRSADEAWAVICDYLGIGR